MNLHYIYVPEWIKKMKLNTYTYKICIKNGLRMDGHVKTVSQWKSPGVYLTTNFIK